MKNTTQRPILSRNWIVCVLAIFCCLLWGSAFPSIKIGYQLFQIDSSDIASQICFAGIRFALAGILVILFASVAEKKPLKPSIVSIPVILKLCMFQTVFQYFFFYVGLAHTSGVNGSIITSSNVFLAILFSSLLFKLEDLNASKIFGCVLGFIGVIVINLGGGSSLSFNFWGDGFVFLAALSASLSSILMKYYSKDYNPILLSGYQFLFGGIIMTVGASLFHGTLPRISSTGLVLLLYLAFVSAVAYSLWAMLLKYNPISKVTIFGFTNPIFGVILSTFVLHEGGIFNVRSMIALILVCVGIFAVNRS